MKNEKKSFSETKFYPVVFMLLITVFFVGILAVFHQKTKQRVEDYKQFVEKKMILSLFFNDVKEEKIDTIFEATMKRKIEHDVILYEATQNGKKLGYCFPIKGKGLWGGIEAFLAVSPNYSTILGFEITSQNETPGLGGRITEDQFKNQFQNKIIWTANTVQKFNLVAEEENNPKKNEIRQITGATLSSQSVVKMIYDEYKIILEKLSIAKI